MIFHCILKDRCSEVIIVLKSVSEIQIKAKVVSLDSVAFFISLQEGMLYSRAFWVSKETIAWNVDAGDGSCYLYGSKNATLSVENGEIQGSCFTHNVFPIYFSSF